MIGYLIPMRLASEVINAQVVFSTPKKGGGQGKQRRGREGRGGRVHTHLLQSVPESKGISVCDFWISFRGTPNAVQVECNKWIWEILMPLNIKISNDAFYSPYSQSSSSGTAAIQHRTLRCVIPFAICSQYRLHYVPNSYYCDYWDSRLAIPNRLLT